MWARSILFPWILLLFSLEQLPVLQLPTSLCLIEFTKKSSFLILVIRKKRLGAKEDVLSRQSSSLWRGDPSVCYVALAPHVRPRFCFLIFQARLSRENRYYALRRPPSAREQGSIENGEIVFLPWKDAVWQDLDWAIVSLGVLLALLFFDASKA